MSRIRIPVAVLMLVIALAMMAMPVSALVIGTESNTAYFQDLIFPNINYQTQAQWCFSNGFGSSVTTAANAGTHGNGTQTFFGEYGDPFYYPQFGGYITSDSSGSALSYLNTWDKNGSQIGMYLVCQYNGGLNGAYYHRYHGWTNYNTTPYPGNATVKFVVTSTTGYSIKVSNASINISSGQYGITDPQGNATIGIIPPAMGYTYTATAAGYSPIAATTLGAYGLNGGTVYVQMAPTSASPMYFRVRDWKTKVTLGTINVNIQNITSGEWRNVTNTPGDFAVADTGASHQYPTVLGQSVGIDVSALGYLNPNDQSKADLFQYITIQNGTAPPNNPYYIDLLANNDKIYNGTWNLDIALTDCDSHAALNGATVNLITGLNGWCTGPLGCFPNNIVNGGHYVFTNVTASLVASYTMGKPGYQSKTDTIQLVYPTNYSTSKAYCLLQIGSTSTATPTPTYSGNGTQVVTTGPTTAGGYPTITGSASDKATAAFNVFVDAAYAIATIVVGIIFIWLLWMTVYIITGGKIIDKIMKRGRH